jgi:muramoyltetrapeptide carboxypeptidase
LFLEEIGERAYRLDRLLTQLSQNSVQMKAIVIGEFIGGAESTGQNFGAQTVMAWAKSLKVPVYRGLACGHGESNRPLFMGAKAELAKTINGFELSQKSGVF